MNYRHLFHAGNTADVIKHTILLLLLNSLKEKVKGFCFIDTHAGSGIYDLSSNEANKTKEYLKGISLIRNYKSQHYILQHYLNLIAEIKPNHYPGSPWFASELLRVQDKGIFNELHPTDYLHLKNIFKNKANVSIHNRNAYECLPALLPPNPRRGLVLIDPPFEDFSEKEKIISLMHQCHKKWPEGIYMIWLPIKDLSLKNFHNQILKISFKNCAIINFKWRVNKAKENPMSGCSIVIFNLPYNSKEPLLNLLAELKLALSTIEAEFDLETI